MKDKKQLLINAAVRRFCEDGLGASTASVAKEAGVSNGTLFNYFATKQELIDEVYLALKTQMADQILSKISEEDDFKTIFYLIGSAFIRWALASPLNHKAVMLLKNSQMLSPHVVEKVEMRFASVFAASEKAIKDKVVKDMSLELLGEIYMANIDSAISYLSKKDDLSDGEITEIIDCVFDAFWNGVKASK